MGGGDYTAGVKMGRTPDGRYIVANVVNEQLSTNERDRRVMGVLDMERISTYIEREGGSSGKDVAVYHGRIFAGYPVHSETVTGSKEFRAEPFAAQCEAGNVDLVRSRWNNAYIDQLCMFPNGAHDDMVDASSGAFSKVADVWYAW
ncbi:MAG: phage terminase large subunit [Anaerolineae bacterium]